MRFTPVATILLLSVVACAKPATPVDATHPIIGIWEFSAPGSSCLETSQYMPDGTSIFESAEEKGRTRYEISSTASAAGFYKLVDTLSESNGKPSCSGRVIPVGHKITVYLKFLPSLQEMNMCVSESDDRCIGKFVRRDPARL